jgi:UDP-N-acetylglucosamine transferase subunit ALG13
MAAAAADAAAPRLLVTMGTDHHPFDRLVRWVDGWLERGGAARVSCLIQSSTSRPAHFAPCQPYLGYVELQAALRTATAVVCHGGPGTIMECRAVGLVPIVVPRRRRLGEVVDDHQVAFARRMATTGDAHLAETQAALHQLLDRVLLEPQAFRSSPDEGAVAATVARFAELVDSLVSADPAVGRPRRRQRNVV